MSTSASAGTLSLQHTDGKITLLIRGDWTLAHYAGLRHQVSEIHPRLDARVQPDPGGLGALDTAGALLLLELIGPEGLELIAAGTPGLPAGQLALLRSVVRARAAMTVEEEIQPAASPADVLAHIGKTVDAIWKQQRALLGFIGLTLETLVKSLMRPGRWRVTSLVAHIEQTGLDAVPIVALLTFLVGAVVAFLGSTVLSKFGASIYTVNLVAFAFLREFGVLLAAILIAGRTASAYAAQIGSMKANEEVDAIRTLGLDPVELLVLPRVLAMLACLPILSFIAVVCGITGGAVVCALKLDISLTMFLTILQRDIPVNHFLVGLAKAPVFAFIIAVIGCLEGFKVSGSAQSVGEHTTSSVVQSIFMVILIDALAAMFFMEMGW